MFQAPDKYAPRHTYYATGSKSSPDDSSQKILLAYDLASGKMAWKYPQIGSGRSSAGTMTTSSGLLFFGDDAQSFEAVDGRTGAPLWHFNTGQTIVASPMSFAISGNQYVTIAAGSDVFCFGLL